MYEKILVPLDGSELAEVALPYAEDLAGRLGCEVTLLYVGGSNDVQYRHMYQLYLEKMVEDTKHNAEKYREKAAGGAIKVESVILAGNPAEEILDYADKENISRIIMATHGQTGVKRWTLGTVADKVMRGTKRAVFLIRVKGARPDVREKNGIINKLLVPLDGSREGEAVIDVLFPNPKREIILFQVVGLAYHLYPLMEGGSGVSYTDEEMKPLIANAADYLQKAGSRLKDKCLSVRAEVRVGNAAEEIIKLADELLVDGVAMTTHGRSGVGRWVFGSVAARVLREGNTPLLLVRSS